eukprot:CAMPEP_0175070074 /NCGR_PEP_ID=MMETSP0052_2-20121109/18523_1 /TAXON_ID=51329 ORGANISM="Polytomella parva, Strain SAG 63-3" /NCGR_SAMPLE_ID=MMETSP0052_2 /ASSEMBLY_ACC=CAM_ASM_000194 /LENGTH=140 /DNA_ID=CAMNT_0016337169 /DNA_START=222 /DNA_END=641 /DNA_ORIENTATION=-
MGEGSKSTIWTHFIPASTPSQAFVAGGGGNSGGSGNNNTITTTTTTAAAVAVMPSLVGEIMVSDVLTADLGGARFDLAVFGCGDASIFAQSLDRSVLVDVPVATRNTLVNASVSSINSHISHLNAINNSNNFTTTTTTTT